MMHPPLLSKYEDIIARIDAVDAEGYARSRNYINGAVSYLSPYISRGVISLPLVKSRVLQRYTMAQAHTFIFELAWREFFQRQWWRLGNGIYSDINGQQKNVLHQQMPVALLQAQTGINAVDDAVNTLYATGYMHNHVRMYVASMACNIARAHWSMPAAWLYYHLADHDIASNTLSWQWVAGSFSNKKYYCDQQNINKYCGTQQVNTFLDVEYHQLPTLQVPQQLSITTHLQLTTQLPAAPLPLLDNTKPLLLYNAYNLSPTWRNNINANRVLLLEPSHYKMHPVSNKVLSFILSLAGNITGIQIYCGEVNELTDGRTLPGIYSIKHPAFSYYPGTQDEPEWMFPEISEVKGSFMNYWKKCEKLLKRG